MFGINLTEILLILLVALIVLGPEEFPKAVKKFIALIKEGQKILASLKNSL